MVTTAEKIIVYFSLLAMILIATYIGLAGIISFILLPALLAYSVVRLGYRHALFECMLLVLCLSFISGTFAAQAFFSIVPGVVLGICIQKQKCLRFALSATALSLLALEGIMYISASIVSRQELAFAQNFMQEAENAIKTLGLPAAESAMFLEMMQMYLPSVLIMSVAMLAYGAFLVAHTLLRKRMPIFVVQYPRFRELSVRKSSLAILVLTGIVAFADSGVVGTVAANLMLLMCFYIILCGYGLLVYMISNMRSGAMKIILYFCLAWMFSMVSPAAFFLGLSDAFIHFRNRKRGDIE